MQTRKSFALLSAFALAFFVAAALAGAPSPSPSDTAPKADEPKKECCHPAKASGAESGAHCAKHGKAGEGKACCADHAAKKDGAEDTCCCCCDDACPLPGAKQEPKRS